MIVAEHKTRYGLVKFADDAYVGLSSEEIQRRQQCTLDIAQRIADDTAYKRREKEVEAG